MKAIRGDNPRTTNQRVYLMPVVPSPLPEKPRHPRRGTVFPLFPLPVLFVDASLSLSIYLSIYLPPGFSHSLSLSLPLLSLLIALRPFCRPSTPFCHPFALALASSRCCSRICHYATDITNSRSLFSLLFSFASSLVVSLSSPHFPVACYLQRVVRSRTPAI